MLCSFGFYRHRLRAGETMKVLYRRTEFAPKPEYQDLWDALASDYRRELEQVGKKAFWHDTWATYDAVTRDEDVRVAVLFQIEEINERFERLFRALGEGEPEGHA
jgi:hypothetical protein